MINDANTIDLPDLDDIQDPINDTMTGSEPDVTKEPEPEPDPVQDNDFDLTKELLSLLGISDMNKIKFEDESGAVIEKTWDSLTNNEKLMILSHQEDPDTSLDAAEIELINLIRESGLTPDQYIQNLQKSEPQPTVYEVDNMSDDELFCIDLLDKIGSENITDEELQDALTAAKSNKSLFDKQVASLRVYYKDLEEKRILQDALEQQQKREQEFEMFSNNIVDAIKNFNALDDMQVELSRDEMDDLANYILTRDDQGYSEFGRLLNDPVQFTKAAFWMLKGSEILNEMQNKIKEAYLRGYNETHEVSKNKRVFTKTPSTQTNNNNKEPQFAFFDEDSYLNN